MAMISPVRMMEYQARHLRLALAACEPLRIVLGMCTEAACRALGGPPALRAHELLDEARRWAAQVDDRFTEAYVALAEGAVAFMCGQWRHSLDRSDAAEQMFRNSCVGVAWEIGTANFLEMSNLVHMTRVHPLRPRMARALDDAARRHDLYATSELRSSLQPMLCLMDDQLEAARDVVARAREDLSRRTVTVLHWQCAQSNAWAELYAGNAAKAVEVLGEALPAMRRAFLTRVYIVKAFVAYSRTTAWLGALSDGARESDRLQASIRRVSRDLGKDPISRAASHLISAELSVLRGELDAAVATYRNAALGFDAVDMIGHAAVARWRLGELVGGDEGRALLNQARAALDAEGIVRPDRVVAMYAPVAADARIRAR
jgi:hypothetical protein